MRQFPQIAIASFLVGAAIDTQGLAATLSLRWQNGGNTVNLETGETATLEVWVENLQAGETLSTVAFSFDATSPQASTSVATAA